MQLSAQVIHDSDQPRVHLQPFDPEFQSQSNGPNWRDARQVDVWALGISAIEMAEVKPPRWAVHPMRVIFMISREPPPRLADDARWSLTLQNFVATCLQKA